MSLFLGKSKIPKIILSTKSVDGGISTNDATLTSGDSMLEGVTAYSNGKKYTGTIPTVEAPTPSISINTDGVITANVSNPMGFQSSETNTNCTKELHTQGEISITPNESFQVAVAAETYTTGNIVVKPIPSNYIDTSDATATSSDIIEGITAYVDGEKVTGNRAHMSFNMGTGSVADSSDMQVVGISQHYQSANQGRVNLKIRCVRNCYANVDDSVMTEVAIGTASTSDVVAGKTFSSIDGMSITGTMPSKDAETFVPTTTNQIIVQGQYLAGEQIIQGDVNLIPENIASGVNIFGVTGTHEGGSTFDTSDATATSADILSGKTAYVNGEKIIGSYGIATDTVITTPSSDVSSISFTVSSEPIAWSMIQTSDTRDWGNIRFICACNSNGNSTSMTTVSNYGRQYAYSNYITSTYSDGTLTVSTSNSSNSGTFRGGVAYQLLYIYVNIVEVEPEPELPADAVGAISSDNVISLSDATLASGTYTMYYEDENNNKLDGWDAIGTINK